MNRRFKTYKFKTPDKAKELEEQQLIKNWIKITKTQIVKCS